LVFGNDRSGLPYIRDMIQGAYSAGQGFRQIQRIDLNLDPLSSEDLRELKQGRLLGTYHVFQETYDRTQYALLHPSATNPITGGV